MPRVLAQICHLSVSFLAHANQLLESEASVTFGSRKEAIIVKESFSRQHGCRRGPSCSRLCTPASTKHDNIMPSFAERSPSRPSTSGQRHVCAHIKLDKLHDNGMGATHSAATSVIFWCSVPNHKTFRREIPGRLLNRNGIANNSALQSSRRSPVATIRETTRTSPRRRGKLTSATCVQKARHLRKRVPSPEHYKPIGYTYCQCWWIMTDLRVVPLTLRFVL